MSPTMRTSAIVIGAQTLPLPIFFPSISSIKTALLPQEYLQLIGSLAPMNAQFLASAFDLANIDGSETALRVLTDAKEHGVIALMDSGNYESFWKDARSVWTQEKFHGVLKKFPFDLAFCFDEQNPPADKQEHLKLIVDGWTRDQAAAGACQIIPIIHASAEELPSICSEVAKKTGVHIVAVPERRLGDGIFQRFDTVRAIRRDLNHLGRYVALHLLGTGNPISIATYTAAGADSFDGLEWCQTVVDHDTGLLYHLSQAEFFSNQTHWGDADLSFQARTLAHNLEFFSSWIGRLREAVNQGRIREFCRLNLSPRVYAQIAKRAEWGAQ